MWEHLGLDVKTGVEFLKRQGGVHTVVLFGHSGGAATLSFYQAVAEKGTAFCGAPGKLTVCGKELSNLPRADGLILVDASLGNPAGPLRGLNPAVVTEGDPKTIDSARSLQHGQRVQSRGLDVYSGVQAEVLRGAGRAHAPSHRRGRGRDFFNYLRDWMNQRFAP